MIILLGITVRFLSYQVDICFISVTVSNALTIPNAHPVVFDSSLYMFICWLIWMQCSLYSISILSKWINAFISCQQPFIVCVPNTNGQLTQSDTILSLSDAFTNWTEYICITWFNCNPQNIIFELNQIHSNNDTQIISY